MAWGIFRRAPATREAVVPAPRRRETTLERIARWRRQLSESPAVLVAERKARELAEEQAREAARERAEDEIARTLARQLYWFPGEGVPPSALGRPRWGRRGVWPW